MCITKSINIDSHQANLKAFIQHYITTQNGHYTSFIEKGNNWYQSNDNQMRDIYIETMKVKMSTFYFINVNVPIDMKQHKDV